MNENIIKNQQEEGVTIFPEGKIAMKKDRWYNWKNIVPSYSIKNIKKFGDEVKVEFIFYGNAILKAGVFREGYSYNWIYENRFESSEKKYFSFILNLSDFKEGILDFKIFALEDSAFFINAQQTESVNTINNSQKLYDVVSPSLALCTEQPLYYKLIGDNCFFSYLDKNIYFRRNTIVDLCTYFNSFSACKWIKYTNVRNVSIWIEISGNAFINIIKFDEYGELCDKIFRVESKNKTKYILKIENIENDNIIGFRIYAENSCVLYGAGWLSCDDILHDIKLGIGITTFKREEAVKKSVKRLYDCIKEDSIYKDKIDIVVVDNGKTLKQEDVDGALLIPNSNYGGTGGFMRSLIHFIDEKKYTHCLFMDDDASTEASSIYRSISFLQHSVDDSTAISGAMLSEKMQFMQWESGAYFDTCCRPLHCHYNLGAQDILAKNEKEDCPYPRYGAWWFFLFPINKVQMFSFPFFVRGDDVEFSYINKFNIVNMNGIGTWQEDFKQKESPQTVYQDVRAALALHLMLSHVDDSYHNVMKMLWNFFSAPNNSYMYDSANAVLQSFNDALKGPKYWVDNLDTAKIRERNKKKYIREKYTPIIEKVKKCPVAREILKPGFGKLVKWSCNGHLLPNFMFNKTTWRLTKYDIPNPRMVFLRKKIYIHNQINDTMISLRINRKYYFKNLIYFIYLSIKYFFVQNKIKNNYIEFKKKFVSEDIWKEFYKLG